MKLAVQYRPIAGLTPSPRNARTHSKDQIRQLAESIKSFGWTSPILVDGADIIAGHGRLAAAKLLKMTEVPVIELSGLTAAQKRAYMIADNQLALDAGWDDDLLAGELQELKLADFDLNLIGFPDLDAAMGEPPARQQPGIGATNLQYGLIFETEAQRTVWFDFTRKLKGKYPDIETLGERLFQFLNDGEHIVAR